MSRKTTRDISDKASLEYSDVLVAYWAHDLNAELKVLAGKPVIMLPMTATDGFFMLYDGDGTPLPLDRSNLAGWQLVIYVPEDYDPDGQLDSGAVLFITDHTDVDTLIATSVPTIRVVSAAITG